MNGMTMKPMKRIACRTLDAALSLSLMAALACGGGTGEVATGEEEHAEEPGAGEHDVVVVDSAAMEIANITIETVGTALTTGLPVTGTITYDANRVSHIGPRTEGRIVQLGADVGDSVGSGQALAVLESPEVGQLRADETEAQALVSIARENFEREQRLENQGISSRKELLTAEAELRRAEAALTSAHERLRVLGAGDGEGGQYALTSPFAGIVVARDASLGEMASPADQLFTVANLERLWIELDIYERDLARVARGQELAVTTAAYPGRVFPGRIVYVGDILDPVKRTVRARVDIPNPERALKPGMFATARIQVGGDGPPLVTVPEAALQEVEGRQVVFVPGELPGEFRARPVEVGDPTDGGRLVVLSGLAVGDRVVTTGAFALRSELAEAEIGDAGH